MSLPALRLQHTRLSSSGCGGKSSCGESSLNYGSVHARTCARVVTQRGRQLLDGLLQESGEDLSLSLSLSAGGLSMCAGCGRLGCFRTLGTGVRWSPAGGLSMCKGWGQLECFRTLGAEVRVSPLSTGGLSISEGCRRLGFRTLGVFRVRMLVYIAQFQLLCITSTVIILKLLTWNLFR